MAEIATFCTSIIARDTNNRLIHVRNLDFYYTDVLKQLVFNAVLVRDGQIVAESPVVAGVYGTFTVRKENKFSISYNVREREQGLL